MYRDEVPLYGTLVGIVQQVDATTIGTKALKPRHKLERHGAIRLGTDYELRTIKRLFAIMGMHPVGYYDLSVVGFPLHATAFRPIDEAALVENPFRVFTTLLRMDMLTSPQIRRLAEEILSRRKLFSDKLLSIMDRAECRETNTFEFNLSFQDADDFITESLKIFRWHSRSNASLQEYQLLRQSHPMLADIACFPSAHINHLTPRTLNIDLVQQEMIRMGLPAKDYIEGPPSGRKCPILLRQTSFKALEEKVIFRGIGGASPQQGSHTARFGEIEQRGAAVTRKGRRLYDELLAFARQEQRAPHIRQESPGSQDILSAVFQRYPDEWEELRTQELVFFNYQPTYLGEIAGINGSLTGQQDIRMEQLLSQGFVEYEPIIYEDFLPFSAAGIFTSNLTNGKGNDAINSVPSEKGGAGKRDLERVLDCPVLDEFELYSQMQQRSIDACAEALGLSEILVK